MAVETWDSLILISAEVWDLPVWEEIPVMAWPRHIKMPTEAMTGGEEMAKIASFFDKNEVKNDESVIWYWKTIDNLILATKMHFININYASWF